MRIHSDLSGKEHYRVKGKDIVIPVPRRLYIFTDHLGVLVIGARTQAWLPFLGSMPPRWYWWWPIVWHPSESKPGWLYRNYPEKWFHDGVKRENR